MDKGILCVSLCVLNLICLSARAASKTDTLLSDTIQTHRVRVDKNGYILPWFSANEGRSYDHCLKLLWNFWKNMETDSNGVKYYLNHDVWSKKHDRRGIGADQLMSALSSWDLYYNYTGDQEVLENMKYIADYYLSHSLSSARCKWPNLPYPINTALHSGVYDGDMVLGKNYLQPDKAGSFGFELVKLYKKTDERKYLIAAIKIANTLAAKVRKGDADNSPWPFKVNALNDQIGKLEERPFNYQGILPEKTKRPKISRASYTTGWTSTLGLFEELIALKQGKTKAYKNAFKITLTWLKRYPAKTNKWGPFFEDIAGWSDTQINGITYAMFIIQHPQLDNHWKQTVKHIFDWVYTELSNNEFKKYGVICVNEQSAYRVPGNSHTSREASVELMYAEKSGDTSYSHNAVLQLNWATYTVNEYGENRYIRDDIWLTDGYTDYIRHYLRAMAARPQLAPDDQNHLLRSSSIVKLVNYGADKISYKIFDNSSIDELRLKTKPTRIKVNSTLLNETSKKQGYGWNWQPLTNGGVLKIKQNKGRFIEIYE